MREPEAVVKRCEHPNCWQGRIPTGKNEGTWRVGWWHLAWDDRAMAWHVIDPHGRYQEDIPVGKNLDLPPRALLDSKSLTRS